MRREDIARGRRARRPWLEQTLFCDTAAQPGADDVRERLRRAERKLEALRALLDQTAFHAATTHLQLVCRPTGYAVVEADEPPPEVDSLIDLDGGTFRVDGIRPSPFPADSRRCAVLALTDVASDDPVVTETDGKIVR